MDKIKLVAVILVIIAATAMALVLVVHQAALIQDELNVSRPEPGYIDSTSIYLIESNLSYETFKDSYFTYILDGYFYIQGEPCTVIRGTIRNDGANDSWIGISAIAYDKNGQRVGTVITRSTKPWFETVSLKSNETVSFEIPVKYSKKDITRYELTLNFGPAVYPSP